MADLESTVQRAIITAAVAAGYEVVRINGGATRTGRGRGWVRFYTWYSAARATIFTAGIPDLLLLRDAVGRRTGFWVETKKSRGGRLSPEQQIFAAVAGGVLPVVVCRSVEEFEAARARIEAEFSRACGDEPGER